MYLNSTKVEGSDKVQGLGFGGMIGEFRLWIDNDIDTKSYLRPKDKTYEIGYIAGKNNTLNLQRIEIIGFGGEEGLTERERY